MVANQIDNRLLPGDAKPFHLLVLAQDVAPLEVEILASCLWPDVHWGQDGRLIVEESASLSGPWSLDPHTITQLDLPIWAATGYLVTVPTIRGAAPPPALLGLDPMIDAFPEGGPEGLEAQVLDGLRKIARRLAGALRLNSGVVIVPDPDSAVNMRVLTPVWLDPAACLRVVREVHTQARSLLENPGENPPARPGPRTATPWSALTPEQRQAFDKNGLRAAAVEGLEAGERAWIHAEAEAFDQAALSMPEVFDAYALAVPLSSASEIHVIVQGETALPLAFGPAPDGAISYEIRWIPRDIATVYANRPPRSTRLERLAAIDLIEKIARVLARATEGKVFDADDFLVATD